MNKQESDKILMRLYELTRNEYIPRGTIYQEMFDFVNSLVIKGDEYPYEYTEEDLEQLKKDGWIKIRNNSGLSEE